MDSKSFTLKADNGILNVLKTDCGVSLPFLPNTGAPDPVIHTFVGLWDTGATGSVISKRVVKQLNLTPTGKVNVFHANGSCIVNTYLVNLYLPNHVVITLVTVTEGDLNGTDILVGMDVITKGDFSITNLNDKTCFSFRIPSVWEKDFVHESLHTPVIKPKEIGRNEKCPCGSGRKYKNCCINK